MAKRASMTLDGFTSNKPGTTPAPSIEATVSPEATRSTGRPRSLPDGVKTISVRVSPAVRRALRQASLDHDRPIQQILTDGIMDQLARLGVVVEE